METAENMTVKMDQSRSSKIFLVIFFLAIAFSLGMSYWRIVIKRDYNIVASVDCDPYEERCFVHVCDPDPDVDGECTGNPEEDTWYAKNISRKAYNIPECDPADENCKALECQPGEESCFYELCGESNVPQGDKCNDPEQYVKDNPIEEDVSDCEEGDEECAANQEDGAKEECLAGDEKCAPDADKGADCEEGDSECAAGKEETQ